MMYFLGYKKQLSESQILEGRPQRRLTSWRKLHTAAEEEDYFVEETGAEDDDTVEDDEPDHEPCEEVPASCDSVSTVFPTVDRNIFLLQPRLSYLVT